MGNATGLQNVNLKKYEAYMEQYEEISCTKDG